MSNPLQQDHYKVKPKEEKLNVEEGEAVRSYIAGRGAQFNTKNRFLKNEKVKEHAEGIDDWEDKIMPTQYIEMDSKSIVNKIESQDVGMGYSMNPYAGLDKQQYFV